MSGYLTSDLIDRIILMYVDIDTLSNALILTKEYKDTIYHYALFNRIDVGMSEVPELMDKVPALKDVFSKLITEKYRYVLHTDFGKRIVKRFKDEYTGPSLAFLNMGISLLVGQNNWIMTFAKNLEHIANRISTNTIECKIVSKDVVDLSWDIRITMDSVIIDILSNYDSGVYKEMLEHMKKLPELRETLNKIFTMALNAYVPKDSGKQAMDKGREFFNRPGNEMFKQGFDVMFPVNAAPNPKVSIIDK